MRKSRIHQVMREAVKTSDCTHRDPPHEVCIRCAPRLWNSPQEWNDETVVDIYNAQVENLLRWKYEYYVEGESSVSDDRYDCTENSLKRIYPEHPVLAMVGYNAELVTECMEFIGKIGARYASPQTTT